MAFCSRATEHVFMSDKPESLKTYCAVRGTWTTCEVLGRCTIADGPYPDEHQHDGEWMPTLFSLEGAS